VAVVEERAPSGGVDDAGQAREDAVHQGLAVLRVRIGDGISLDVLFIADLQP
jgi:hypothetical protein